ncbi:MAG: YIP1 family protein [Clostridia bacterium]|nr:YIP1 family protein [Clostridia bacterium]
MPIIIIAICVAVSQFFKYANRVNKRGMKYKEKRGIWEEFLYGFHVIFHPFDGFWDIKHEKRASVKGATFILIITILTFIYNAVGQSYLMNPYYNGISFLVTIMSVLLPVILWTISNWCLTTLFDGEGSFKDVYVTTCYSLLPLPMLIIPATLASNIVTNNEISLITLLTSFAFIWTGLLLFFGMMVIHDYTIGKNILTSLASVVGMAFIMFLGILFSNLVQKVFYFGYNIYVELKFRWA